MKAMIRSIVCVPLFLITGVFHSTAAVTAVQTIGFGGSSENDYTSAGDGFQISVSASTALNGFTRFDPSLGTLTEILLTVEMDAYLTLTLIVDDIEPDSATEFTVLYDPSDGLSVLQAGIIYSPTGNSIGIVTTIDAGSLNTLGTENEDSTPYLSDQGEGLQFFYTDEVTVTFGGFSSGGSTATTASLSASHPDFNPSDFIGFGNVSGLSVDNIVFIENGPTSLQTNNVPIAYIAPDMGFFPGNATLQYVYTPVPEPSAGCLLLLAGALTGWRRRR